MGRILTIASQKGGVGKTTTAVNLACTLSLAGKKVLLIDFDPQGNASSGIGLQRTATPLIGVRPTNRNAFLAEIIEGESLEPFITKASNETLSVIPSSSELSQLEIIKELQDTALPRLKKQIDKIAKKFDFTLFDCPPSLGGIPTIALSVSDSVLVPIQCEYYAMEGLSQILPVIRELQKSRNPKLSVFGLLLTMFSEELQLSHDIVEEVRSHFGELVFETIIPRDVVLAEAASHGIPVFEYAATSRGAWSYIELAKEVLEHEHA